MPAPFDSLELVLDAARMRLNDMIASVGGDILTDNNVFTIYVINTAYRKMQEFLAKLGFSVFTEEAADYVNLSPANPVDPSNLPYMNWSGSWNGSTLDSTNFLPADLVTPKRLDERITGSGTAFLEMDKFTGRAMPLILKSPWNRSWEWRGETLFLQGALAPFDLRLRYDSFLSDFVPNASVSFASQLVPILRCLDSFSNYIAAEMSAARGDLDAATFTAAGEAAATILVARENPGVLAPPEAA